MEFRRVLFRSFLEQRLAYRIQELTLGGPSKPVRQLLDALADEVEGKKVRKSVISDPRNPVIGTRLVREWNGAEHVITVLKDGFDWQGRRYKSLSAIARDITGTQWNGRSEEHTSELPSLMRISYAVFCLKKKNTTIPKPSSPHIRTTQTQK